MPRNEIVLNVFVASPSEVNEERTALESIIVEINKTWSTSLNLRFDLIKWETDVYPGFGKYPQDVINNQINEEYDIFIAIFWSKIGTPTKTAESGTCEELERALKKYKKDKDSVDILIYFKDQAISPSKMDFVQLQKVQELKTKLGNKGGLYWIFDSTDDFESLLRSHLSKVAQKWSEKLSKENKKLPIDISNSEPDKNSTNEETLDESDYGLFDYIEMYEERMLGVTKTYEAISEATEKIGEQFNQRTAEINSFLQQGDRDNIKKRKKLINLASNDMEQYADVIETKIKISTNLRIEAFEALSKALVLKIDFTSDDDTKDFEELEQSLISMQEAINDASNSISGFRKAVSELPKLTVHINKSKKRVIKALDEVIGEINSTINSSQNVLDVIEDLRNGKQI